VGTLRTGETIMHDWTENYYKNSNNTARDIKDLDYIFGIHPTSKDIRKKTDVMAIKQSIKTLVLLNHYEKPFHPDIGCDIYKSLFEPFEGKFTEEMITRHIHNVIDNYEPRAILEKIEIDVREDDNFFGITIWFTPIGEVDPVSVDIFLRILR
jgi:phage baseplate assembly protein W